MKFDEIQYHKTDGQHYDLDSYMVWKVKYKSLCYMSCMAAQIYSILKLLASAKFSKIVNV